MNDPDVVVRYAWTASGTVYHEAMFRLNAAGQVVNFPFLGRPCNVSDASRPRRKPLITGDEPPEDRRGCGHCTRGVRTPT
jgi:hypothetical protein